MDNKTINKSLAYIGNKLDTIKNEVVNAMAGDKLLTRVTNVLQFAFKEQNKHMKEALSKINVSVETKLNDVQIRRDLSAIESAVKRIKLEKTDINLKPVIAALTSLQKQVAQNDTQGVKDRLDGLSALLKSVIESNNKPVMIEDSQWRELRTLMGSKGGAVGAGGAPLQDATNVTQARVAMASANTEYSYTFPANTVGFYMKVEAQNAKFFYAWATGTLPGSGTGAAYLTTSQNFVNSRPGVRFDNKTVYFESDVASQTMEIEVYTL